MALLQSFYPRQIPGNAGNFSQTLLVKVPWQLPTHQHTHTKIHAHTSSASTLSPTSLTDTAQRADTWLHMHTQTHTLGNCGGKSGISRNTLEKQEKTEGARCNIVLNKTDRESTGGWGWGLLGTENVRLKQRQEAVIERSTRQISKFIHKNSHS